MDKLTCGERGNKEPIYVTSESAILTKTVKLKNK